jgi:acyl-coenzyme A thioesterase PaaI-like protein
MLIEVENSAAHQNVLGDLHGGISLCASDVLATMALTAPGQPVLATSSIRVAYSRPVPGVVSTGSPTRDYGLPSPW